MLLAMGPAHFLPPLGFVVFYSDPSAKDRDGSGACLVGERKMLPPRLVDLMNELWDLKAPSAWAGSLPSFPSHLLDKRIGKL